MNFPAILDVGLGLVVVFLLLASICSILVEIIANWRKWRHDTLRITINALLQGHEKPIEKPLPQAADTREEDAKKMAVLRRDVGTLQNSRSESMEELFWAHPEIEPLRSADANFPGYMDATRFASVVLDIATGKGVDGVIPDSRSAFSRSFEMHASPKLQERLNSLLRSLPADTLAVRSEVTAALARWYGEAMARTTGGYKRKVQKWLFWTGLAVALVLNCDALRITHVMFRDPGLRSSMVDYAKSISLYAPAPLKVPESAPVGTNRVGGSVNNGLPINPIPKNAVSTNAVPDLQTSLRKQVSELQKLERIGFPIGWVAPFSQNFLPLLAEGESTEFPWWAAAILLKLIGVFATAFAVCLGAPFWFDILNKLVKLRTLGAKTGAGGNESNPAATPSTTSTSTIAAPATSGTAVRTIKPLPAIGEALREPATQFHASKAYWLSEASLLAYATPAEIEATVKDIWRFDKTLHFSDVSTNTQGFLAVGGGVAILAFRGTEPTELPDWETDAKAFLRASQDFPGEIHEGFANALASVYPQVKTAVDALPGSGALLYITGHSLGAALATLCAHRITAARGYPIHGVCNYGSPRVGDPVFANSYQTLLGARTYRLVNNADLVTRVPPRSLGYDHVGEMVYIDDTGKLQRDIGFWYRFLNQVANAAADFKRAAKSTVRDHSMSLYCEHLKRASVDPDTERSIS